MKSAYLELVPNPGSAGILAGANRRKREENHAGKDAGAPRANVPIANQRSPQSFHLNHAVKPLAVAAPVERWIECDERDAGRSIRSSFEAHGKCFARLVL